jgi:CMP-N-acetylneuraminic acid synthetase
VTAIAIVPARAGSKGFPNKNIAQINGVSLLEWAIRLARRSSVVSDTYISTDSADYERLGIAAGAKSAGLRPAELASDTARTVDVVLHLLDQLEQRYEFVVLLQPTSPIRNAADIENMIRRVEELDADAAASVSRLEEPHPHKVKRIGDDGFMTSFIEGTQSEAPRQSLPPAYVLNGAIYVVRTAALTREKTFLPRKTLPYVMARGVNVDTPDDFVVLREVYSKEGLFN